MTRALIFGGSGFIGKHLCHKLLQDGYQTTIFSRTKTGPEGVAYFQGDIEIYDDVERAIMSVRPEWIFNCAAVLTRGTNEADEQKSINVNELGSNNIVNALAARRSELDLQAGVFMGTSMEYGLQGDTPLREDVTCHPLGTYAEAKYRATLYMQEQARQHGLPLVSARIFTPYGIGMNPDSLVARVLSWVAKNQKIMLSDPSVTRDFIYIDDLVEMLTGLAKVAESHSGEVFNCGTGVATSLEEFVQILKNSLPGVQVEWNSALVSKYDMQIWKADMSKTFSVITYRPQTSLGDGIDQLLDTRYGNGFVFSTN